MKQAICRFIYHKLLGWKAELIAFACRFHGAPPVVKLRGESRLRRERRSRGRWCHALADGLRGKGNRPTRRIGRLDLLASYMTERYRRAVISYVQSVVAAPLLAFLPVK